VSFDPTKNWAPDVRKIPECKCLFCGHNMNASASVDGTLNLPEPGDLVLCLKCGAVMKHADDMSVRGMTDEEMDELIADTETMDELAKAVQGIHFIRARAN
jgi:Zn ribbon nucleic-acid-binding protein